MIVVRFPNEATRMKAMGFLIGRFSGHSWAGAEMTVPDDALVPMADKGIRFSVEGSLTHEQILSLRTSAAVAV